MDSHSLVFFDRTAKGIVLQSFHPSLYFFRLVPNKLATDVIEMPDMYVSIAILKTCVFEHFLVAI